MSGLEVAGVILGSIPIIVSALGQYKTIKEKRRFFQRKALYIDRLIQSLKEQEALVEANLLVLLRAAGFDRDEIQAMNLTSHHEVFNRPDSAEELREYLGALYDPYQRALSRCENSLINISTKIGGFTPGEQVRRKKTR